MCVASFKKPHSDYIITKIDRFVMLKQICMQLSEYWKKIVCIGTLLMLIKYVCTNV